MKEIGMEDEANQLANIVFLNAGENKRIKKDPPYKYLKGFIDDNQELPRYLKERQFD